MVEGPGRGRVRRKGRAAGMVLCALMLLSAACGGEGSDGDANGDGDGESVFVDLATLSTDDNLTSYDPGLVFTLDEAQVTTALYDGLTDFDYTDVENPELKPQVAESVESNEDATEWTFTIKDDQVFSNGDPVLPSSFKFAWERNGSADLASAYGYFITYVEGGEALLEGESSTLESVVADDEAMTLTVTLAAPLADFDALVSHPFFGPLPQALVEELEDTTEWGRETMIGNGPFKMERPADDQEVVLVPNERWGGNVMGDTETGVDRLIFRISADQDSAYAAFEAGEGDNATIPAGRYAEATSRYPNTVGSPLLGSYYFGFGWDDEQVGGPENVKLRQAISLAIDRDAINQNVYEGSRALPTGVTPAGIPGFEDGVCDYCDFDPERAADLYDEWVGEGNSLDGPLVVNFNSGAGHEDVVAIMQQNLEEALGIEVGLDPVSESYFERMGEGDCVVCRLSWFADYPAYRSFMNDLFSSAAIGGNNSSSFSDPAFDELIDRASAEPDDDARSELYREAEDLLVNTQTAIIPVNWYTGDQVYSEGVTGYGQPPLGIIAWERIRKG
jgi:oligopeptide transport system substrate-binding protein